MIIRMLILGVLVMALLYGAFLGFMHLMVAWLHFTDEQDMRD